MKMVDEDDIKLMSCIIIEIQTYTLENTKMIVCMHACIYVCMFFSMYVCLYVRMCICLYLFVSIDECVNDCMHVFNVR